MEKRLSSIVMGEFAFDLKIASESALWSCSRITILMSKTRSRSILSSKCFPPIGNDSFAVQFGDNLYTPSVDFKGVLQFEKFNTLLPFSLQIDTPTGPRLNGGYGIAN